MKTSSSRRNRGFTLIEVLLVLVILVVLASLAVVAYGPIQRKANINSAKTQAELLAQAVESYQLAIGSYPSSQSGLNALRSAPGDLADPSKWDGPYLARDIPADPWGQQYRYAYPGQHNPNSFDVWTVSPDGQEIGNWTMTAVK
jgi:general secretion pathway protein G